MVSANVFAHLHADAVAVEIVGIANAVQARHGRDHNHVAAARQQRRRGVQTQFLNLVVDAQILLNVGVRHGNVGFGLIVVVIRNEILNRVVREKLFKLAVELRRERLVVAQDERWTLRLLKHIGNGERLARTRHAKQRLILLAAVQAVHKLPDGLRLVACRLEWRVNLEGHLLKD